MPVFDDAGDVVFIAAEGRDITEKKAQEREIAQKNIELQGLLERIRELDEIKTQFFANVSHELRTPLALILGPAQRLIEDHGTMNAAERRESGEVIARNARVLLKHVNDLLDMSKLEAHKLKIELADTDVAALVRFLASHFAVLAADRNIEFVVDADEDCVAAVDADKLQRILMNLLGNAFKFVPSGGRIRCSLRQSSRELLLQVDDSGPGVQPELRQAIFERFRQGDGGINRKAAGTGLGLAIAKEFVEMHKGRIEVLDSDLGGARFEVGIPMNRLAAADRAAPATLDRAMLDGVLAELQCLLDDRAAGRGTSSGGPARTGADLDGPTAGTAPNGPRVLVVEDNPDMNRFITQCLGRQFEVISAFDGREGLAESGAVPPDAGGLRHHDAERERSGDDRRDAQASRAADDADPVALREGRRRADGEAPRRRRAGLHRQAIFRARAGRARAEPRPRRAGAPAGGWSARGRRRCQPGEG